MDRNLLQRSGYLLQRQPSSNVTSSSWKLVWAEVAGGALTLTEGTKASSSTDPHAVYGCRTGILNGSGRPRHMFYVRLRHAKRKLYFVGPSAFDQQQWVRLGEGCKVERGLH